MNPLRTFLAIPFSTSLTPLATEFQAWVTEQAPNQHLRWSKKENLHLTLRFLGDTDEKIWPKIIEKLSTQLSDCKAFSLPVISLDYFPIDKKKMIAILMHLSDELATILYKLNLTVAEFGYVPETRPYVPHITIVRKTEHLKVDLSLAPIKLPRSLLCQKIILFKSEPVAGGSLYTPLHVTDLS